VDPPDPANFRHYEQLLPKLEAAMWADPSDARIQNFQSFCREMEHAVPADIVEKRHRIVVVVPVADRPRQLSSCIDSLVACQNAFGYAGGITLVVVEDSLQVGHCQAHQQLLEDASGLDARYLGLEKQRNLLESLEQKQPGALAPLVGHEWHQQMGHKGASVTRNIAMLWLASQPFERPLFHFIDSDQAFHVDVGAQQPRYMLNYFYHLDRLFRMHDIAALTGKVVGDPPVSPAVMAGTLLTDVNHVLGDALPHYAERCDFHDENAALEHGAYHDMAAMFGLDNRGDHWRYACPIQGPHTCADTLVLLSERVLRFFDGEHPTRVTPFEYQPVEESMSPARTVYTGNYVINAQGLQHVIPFAPLKLRMAGPTLGRLLRSRLGKRFVQVNLPLLHQRTEVRSGRSEYRSGIRYQAGLVDLSGEYERQFVGDWMLFGMIELLGKGYPGGTGEEEIELSLRHVEQQLVSTYANVRKDVMRQLDKLLSLLDSYAPNREDSDCLGVAYTNLDVFADAIRHNYGEHSQAVMRLSDPLYRNEWRGRLAEALVGYPSHKRVWECLIEAISF